MIIFLFGPDTYRGRQKINQMKEKFINDIDPRGENLELIEGETASLELINQKIGHRSLLAKKRMIIIENLFKNKSKTILNDVYEYFHGKKQDDEDNIIIFWETVIKIKKQANKESAVIIDSQGREKALTKNENKLYQFLSSQKFIQEFKELSNTEASVWVRQEVSQRGGYISHQAVQLLVSLAGNDLWKLNEEINKLINYKLGVEPKITSGGKPIEIQVNDVESLVRGNFDENIFALTDAISSNNKAQALKLLEEQYQAGLTDPYLLNMILRQFKILLQIRQALDLGHTSRKIMSELKLHPFVVQKGINQVRNFSLDSLKKIINSLVKADYSLKTGQADIRTTLDLLLAKI